MTDRGTYERWLLAQVGTQEKPRGSNRQPYAALAGHMNGQPWCATFLVAGAKVTGLRLPPGADTAYTPAMESAFKRAGRLSTTPRPGAIGFLYFPSLGRVAHTFYVPKVSPDERSIWTVEGNSNSDGSREGYVVVAKRRPAHRVTGAVGVRSYGMPYYEENDDMADLKLDEKQLGAIAGAVLDHPVTLTEAAARAIGGDMKAGQSVSVRYLLQWPPLARRILNDHGARLSAIEEILATLTARPSGVGVALTSADLAAIAKAVNDDAATRMVR